MVQLGVIIVLSAVIASMAVAMYAYYLYQPRFIEADAGESITVGPVRYQVTYEGQHNGNEETRPEDTFFKIRIDAENTGPEGTRISGLQFFLIDENGTRTEPVYGGFSDEDLLNFGLEPGRPASYTTQFDIRFLEEKQYSVGIQPRKEQSSREIGLVCLLNCHDAPALP